MATRRIAPLALAMLIAAPLSARAGIADFFGLSGAQPPSAGILTAIAQSSAADIPAPTADAPVMVQAPDTILGKLDLGDFALPPSLHPAVSLP
ncbi:MAG: hypothetical protein ACREFW_07700, partial [Rhizomicrobium sp.]